MKVSKLIHDLEKELTDIRQANLNLSKANEIFRQENIDLRKNQDQDELNREITELKTENKRLYQACHYNEVMQNLQRNFILGQLRES